jgi:hypothetical protein
MWMRTLDPPSTPGVILAGAPVRGTLEKETEHPRRNPRATHAAGDGG